MRRLIFILVLFAITGCSGKQNRKMHIDEEYVQKVETVKKLIASTDMMGPVHDSLMNLDFYNNDMPVLDRAIIYVLDSSCSLCIASLIDFAEILKNTDIGLSLCVLIPEDSRHIVEYYISKNGFHDTDIKVIPGKDPLYTQSVWAEQNSMVYVISDGEIRNRFNYSLL